jgi:hypothetical protein
MPTRRVDAVKRVSSVIDYEVGNHCPGNEGRHWESPESVTTSSTADLESGESIKRAINWCLGTALPMMIVLALVLTVFLCLAAIGGLLFWIDDQARSPLTGPDAGPAASVFCASVKMFVNKCGTSLLVFQSSNEDKDKVGHAVAAFGDGAVAAFSAGCCDFVIKCSTSLLVYQSSNEDKDKVHVERGQRTRPARNETIPIGCPGARHARHIARSLGQRGHAWARPLRY